MSALCNNPGRDRHEIPDSARRIDILPVAINWGDTDIRPAWEGNYVFCSFQCLAAWALEKTDQHDGRVLADGAA